MLSRLNFKTSFLVIYCLTASIQLYAAINNQLFGDEAFYWLESQFLDWSYAELPGWTQWLIAFSEWLLPQHELTVRLPGLMAAFAIPWLGAVIGKKITHTDDSFWQAGLLMLSLPLLSMAGILAVPDIWLVFFTLLAVYFLINCLEITDKIWFIGLGMTLAVGINVHVRFWIIVLLAGILVLWQYRDHKTVFKTMLAVCLPILLIGFIPIIMFNFQHEFPLLNFQFSDRHPWEFQSGHWRFFLIQILVTTPVVFILCLKTVVNQNTDKIPQLLTQLAVWHWLVYALVGFFSDNLRFNIHWTLISYVLILLVATTVYRTHSYWLKWSILTGVSCSVLWILTLLFWLHTSEISESNVQFTENSRGWQELAKHTDQLAQRYEPHQLITDHFMTLAELKFYTARKDKILSLNHPMNMKHGREQQLELMSLSQQASTARNLLIVEHTALKLEEQIKFYQGACEALNGLKLIDSFDYENGIKSYFFFETGGTHCELPPISYIEIDNNTLTGWVLHHAIDRPNIRIKGSNTELTTEHSSTLLMQNDLFNSLDPKTHQLTSFKLDQLPSQGFLQIQFVNKSGTFSSARINH